MPEVRIEDTIVAIATASGEAALAVVRLSGPNAISIAEGIFKSKSGQQLAAAKTFTLHFGWIQKDGETIDEAIVSLFRKPKSFTAEDVVEFSTHGGSELARTVLRLCLAGGARLAGPGEFTRRAFLNGRIDLTQAEAVSDLISASSEKSLKQAMRQLEGKLSAEIKSMRDRLLRVLAHMEAFLDFPEEDHDVFSNREFEQQFSALAESCDCLLETFRAGRIARNGLLCAIVGRPNVGKSSLLNALLGEERAIVTELPGTTRDTIEEAMRLNGIAVRLVDTAGLGVPRDEIDRLGMERARKFLRQADLYLWVLDGSVPLTPEDESIFLEIGGAPCIAVVNKSDLPREINMGTFSGDGKQADLIFCSAQKKEGLDALKEKITARLTQEEKKSEHVHLTRERHRRLIEEARTSLERAHKIFMTRASLEFVVSDLRNALRALGEIIGEVYTDDLLDVIFREFCVGK